MRRAHFRGPGGIAELQVVGRLLQVGVVRPGLQQQHRAVGVLGQPGGEGAPAGTCAYDDDVVFHCVLRLQKVDSRESGSDGTELIRHGLSLRQAAGHGGVVPGRLLYQPLDVLLQQVAVGGQLASGCPDPV